MIWQSEIFYQRFSAIGSTLEAPNKIDEYIDLEKLFINFMFRIGDSDRTYRAINYWLMTYGKYLSPRKIKRKLRKVDFDPALLGALLNSIDHRFPKGDFSSLASLVLAKKKKKLLLGKIPARIPKNPHFLKYGLEAPLVDFDSKEKSHWLRSDPWILKNVPELKNRIQGYIKSVADYRSVLEREGNKSIYYIQEKIDVTYSRAHKIFHENIAPIFK